METMRRDGLTDVLTKAGEVLDAIRARDPETLSETGNEIDRILRQFLELSQGGA